jgi:hypothetical protein
MSLDYSPDGARIITTRGDTRVRVWDASTGRPVTQPEEADANLFRVAHAPGGRLLATACPDDTILIRDLSGLRSERSPEQIATPAARALLENPAGSAPLERDRRWAARSLERLRKGARCRMTFPLRKRVALLS